MELERLMHKVSHKHVRLLAGKKGTKRNVTWMHFVESPSTSSFLNGDEIVLITGIGLNRKEELYDLITAVYQHHVAGILINVGPYIDHVPADVLSFCEEKNLPIYEVPWKIHLSELMHIFSLALTREDQSYIETGNAFKNAIAFPDQEILYVLPLSHRGFQMEWSYTVCLCQLMAEDTNDTSIRTAQLVYHALQHDYRRMMVYGEKNNLIAIIANTSKEELHRFTMDFTRLLNSFLKKEISYSLGVGKTTHSMRCIYKSYRQALAVSRLQQEHKISKNRIFYSDMGIYKLLMSIDDKSILEDYIQQTIQPIIEYDRTNDASLMEVLSSYLKNDGSVKATSEQLFIHRNTVNYRLGKIEEITDMNLSSTSDRLQLTVGLMILHILT
ncbi:PucR C-terminal helix-turn-helix domain-containing protein [Lachnospiraceae bacterium KHCPX20]|nr:PucR C-terminal helix-turn-helix domain-containing protein [Lachnospiraceae bacterium KHCPX20]